MLKINLTVPQTDWRKRLAVAFVSVSFLGLIGLGLPALTGRWSGPRSLQIEEQETVLGAVGRLEGRLPKLAEWFGDFRSAVTHHDVEMQVFRFGSAEELVRQSGRQIQISSQFFDADTLSQERALLGIVTSLHSQDETDSDLAFAK